MRRALASGVIVLSATLTGCSGGGGDGGRSREAPASAATLHDDMCEAASDATAGRVDEARRTFADDHAALHALANDLLASDRQHAGELLRAKEEVESVLERADGRRLGELLRALAGAVGGADDASPCS